MIIAVLCCWTTSEITAYIINPEGSLTLFLSDREQVKRLIVVLCSGLEVEIVLAAKFLTEFVTGCNILELAVLESLKLSLLTHNC